MVARWASGQTAVPALGADPCGAGVNARTRAHTAISTSGPAESALAAAGPPLLAPAGGPLVAAPSLLGPRLSSHVAGKGGTLEKPQNLGLTRGPSCLALTRAVKIGCVHRRMWDSPWRLFRGQASGQPGRTGLRRGGAVFAAALGLVQEQHTCRLWAYSSQGSNHGRGGLAKFLWPFLSSGQPTVHLLSQLRTPGEQTVSVARPGAPQGKPAYRSIFILLGPAEVGPAGAQSGRVGAPCCRLRVSHWYSSLESLSWS